MFVMCFVIFLFALLYEYIGWCWDFVIPVRRQQLSTMLTSQGEIPSTFAMVFNRVKKNISTISNIRDSG